MLLVTLPLLLFTLIGRNPGISWEKPFLMSFTGEKPVDRVSPANFATTWNRRQSILNLIE